MFSQQRPNATDTGCITRYPDKAAIAVALSGSGTNRAEVRVDLALVCQT